MRIFFFSFLCFVYDGAIGPLCNEKLSEKDKNGGNDFALQILKTEKSKIFLSNILDKNWGKYF